MKNKKQKVKIHEGITVSCDVYDDKGNYVGEFIFMCSFCHMEYFAFSEDFNRLYCTKCKTVVGYKLKCEFVRPPDSPGRKHLGFYNNEDEYVWQCGCGHNLHHLVGNLAHTTCEKCKAKTSRKKDLPTMAITNKITWAL